MKSLTATKGLVIYLVFSAVMTVWYLAGTEFSSHKMSTSTNAPMSIPSSFPTTAPTLMPTNKPQVTKKTVLTPQPAATTSTNTQVQQTNQNTGVWIDCSIRGQIQKIYGQTTTEAMSSCTKIQSGASCIDTAGKSYSTCVTSCNNSFTRDETACQMAYTIWKGQPLATNDSNLYNECINEAQDDSTSCSNSCYSKYQSDQRACN